MQAPLWQSSLDAFCGSLASAEPTPAGVAASAAAASFGFSLMAKVLKVSSRKKEFSSSVAKLDSLSGTARSESKRMLQLAEQDVAAFNAYLASTRMPQSTDLERADRKRAQDAAVHKAIEIPLEAAKASAAGIGLCSEATSLTHSAVAADLGAAASLLAGALRAFHLCAESNIRQLAGETAPYKGFPVERAERESRALRQADSVLKQAAATIEMAAARRGARS